MAINRGLLLTTLLVPLAKAQVELFQPCSLLGPFFPAPRIDRSSAEVQSAISSFTKELNTYVAAGDGEYGPITPNTTSFSITLFDATTTDPDAGGDEPFFFEYHHTAPATAKTFGNASADTAYPIGSLTQLFTVFALLAESGDSIWQDPITKYLPELVGLAGNSSDSLSTVQWDDVTLGALAGHMAGIKRDSNACNISEPCERTAFLSQFAPQPPIYLPDTTPIFSNAAFQLLALALETLTNTPFAATLAALLTTTLNMSSTALLAPTTSPFGAGLVPSAITGEPASLALASTPRDLSRFGAAILSSALLPPAVTRRWLKPAASTSNLRNAVGRPWEIYHFSTNATAPIVDVYTKTGAVGRYSSYFGVAPDYGVGFAIQAVDEVVEAPDLNALADVALSALLAVDELGRAQAKALLVGEYAAAEGGGGGSALTLAMTGDLKDPGLAVESLVVNGSDWRARAAELYGVATVANLDYRLYPTNLEAGVEGGRGTRMEFQAVFQDKSALVDQGTPTCITWQTVDQREGDGRAFDRFVFYLDERGNATAIAIPELGVTMIKA